jgi:L-threonylcarbamoyladenylate synthase
MQTVLLKCSDEALARAAQLVRAGQVVGFPTETVYGLGANALDSEAVLKIFAAKDRPADNPLIVHISDIGQIKPLISVEMSRTARRLAEEFWPGPLTMIFPRSERIPDSVTAGLDSVGIRMPSHEDARRFIDACGCPIAAPSANRSGKPSPTTAKRVMEDMDGRIPMILDGGECQVGLESTVLDMTGDTPRILRPGGVTPEDIVRVAGECLVDDTVKRPLRDGEKPRSPGTKYRHYAPRGSLTIFEGEPDKVASAICRRYDGCGGPALILALRDHAHLYGDRRVLALGSDADEMARLVFERLRDADDMGAEYIFSEAVADSGIGLAVMNRLGRAAAFHIERV